ncbi:response regulator transcription factor [Motiliproteus sediminis]|uniref:response regulator transcription factor n=1 Tax=Motiliproteus sediminis TaxID=1468178 RepID=UPI001AEF8138|nr:response regulator transcription factor [Motiliproteus sediminis]
MRLLLVEDDLLLGRGIVDAFTRQGDTMDWLQNGRLGLEALRSHSFDLVVLDLGLPEMDGVEVLRQARQLGIDTPILILTARDQVQDRVRGLDAGADDYLIKPFDLDELNARIRALLRRRAGSTSPKIELHGICVDPASREVTFQGEVVNLSRREYALLLEFLQYPGRILTREQLVERLYSWDERVESNAVEVHVHHLRKKFGSELIKTVRGVGYRVDKAS